MALSRREEQVLLAVWNLKDMAYLLSIKNYLDERTSMTWSIGSVSSASGAMMNSASTVQGSSVSACRAMSFDCSSAVRVAAPKFHGFSSK